jgi:hypothetical protein
MALFVLGITLEASGVFWALTALELPMVWSYDLTFLAGVVFIFYHVRTLKHAHLLQKERKL